MTIPIFVNNEVQLEKELEKATQGYSSFVIITDSHVAEHALPLLITHCEALSEAEVIELEPGEQTKDLDVAAQVYESLLEMNADRKSLIIALGGGVVTDFAAFVASTYKRGIDFLLIPTSLLAMVDAALGGKTGVNVGLTKNAVGTFSDAKATFVFPDFLLTLPEEELNSGFAEMIKHAIIADSALFQDLKDLDSFQAEELMPFIEASASIKMKIVVADPLENGNRKLLNFGHTIGHAIESVSMQRNKPVSHGLAVALGMLVESDIALHHFALSEESFEDIKNCLMSNFDFSFAPSVSFSELLPFLKNDKKNSEGEIYVVKLSALGQAQLPVPLLAIELLESWDRVQNLIRILYK
jgi:3-dehydroquinate synthase